MIGGNCKTPKYIRALNLNNKTSNTIQAKCKFQSGEEENYNINSNEQLKVEKNINKGSYTIVDPIVNLQISANNSAKELNFEPQGVEIHTYDISNNGSEGILVNKI